MPKANKCCVTNCKATTNLKNLSFHQFPGNLDLHLKWKEVLMNHTSKNNFLIASYLMLIHFIFRNRASQ